MLDERQLERIEEGRYRYLVTTLQVFQLQVKPVVSLQIEHEEGRLLIKAVDCELEGLGLVDDFQPHVGSDSRNNGPWLGGRCKARRHRESTAVTALDSETHDRIHR